MRKYLRVPAAVLGLLIVLLSLAGGAVSAEQAHTVNGVTVRYSDFSSSHNECWSYAHSFYYKVWGKTFDSNFYGSDNLLRNRSKEELTLTPEHLKEYVSQAVPGAVIRICNSGCLYGSDPMGHSLFIVSIQSDGFTAFEGGLSARPHCREHFYTWEEFCQTSWLGGRYGYIKYIKWPSASGEEEPLPPVEEPSQPNKEEPTPPSDEEPSQPPVEQPSRPVKEDPELPAQLEVLEVPQLVTYAVGDLNRSGTVDTADYVMLKRAVNGTIRLTDTQLKGGDLNGDGVVDEQDFRLLKAQLYAERLLPTFSFSEMADFLLNLLF